MPSPVADAYTAASGASVYAGRYPSASGVSGSATLADVSASGTVSGMPAWVSGVSTRTWAQLSGTNFATAAAAVVPAGSYIGAAPIASMVDAYSDPVSDSAGRYIYTFGGGHHDGTCNALLKFDAHSLALTSVIAPTPPAKYPPIYAAGDGGGGPGALTYPSGATPGYFSSTLTDPADASYIAPADAPNVSHQYASGAMRSNGVISWFYNGYREANTGAGTWAHLADTDIGAQLYAINTNYQNGPLQQGTAAEYDDVTDRFLVTLVPGDAGYNWRVGFFLFNPTTRTIVSGSVVTNVDIARSAMNVVKAGRYVYGLMCKQPSAAVDCSFGWRYNLDTAEFKYIQTSGDTFTFTPGSFAETVPCSYHSGRGTLIRWNYKDEINNIYEVGLTPTSGTGTLGDPLILTQTRIAIAGTSPGAPTLNYRRMFYNATTDCVLFLPKAASDWYAVKL